MGSALAVSHADAVARPRRLNRLWAMLLLVTVPVLALDQLSKLYIATHFQLYEGVAVVPNWLDMTYTLNPGAAFSLFATMPEGIRDVFFLTLSAIAIVVLVVLMARRSPGPLTNSIAFALILGGTIGNLIDRVARGKVIDFIFFHHDWFRYPVFNVADSAITIGVAIILIFNVVVDRSEREGDVPSRPGQV